MASNNTKTAVFSTLIVESSTTEWTTSPQVMGSSTTSVDEPTSMVTNGGLDFSRQDGITMLSETPITSDVTGTSDAVFPDSATTLLSNASSEEVDLLALNLTMFHALMPTVLYMVVLMVVGAVGNTVVFLVYYRRFKPSATRTYVLAMSVCDLTANVASLPSEIIDMRYLFTFDLPWLCRSVRFVNSFLTLTSAFVLVAVARDRFNKICHPLDKHRSMKRIQLYVLVCALASLALSLVFGALNGSRIVPTGVGNTTGVTCSVSDLFADTLFPLIYNMIMALSFVSCVAIMVVCYIRIGLELWRHKKKQARVSGAAPITSARAGPCRGQTAKGLTPVVEDTSSGPVNKSQHSDTKLSSSAELIPLQPAHGSGRTLKSQKTPPSTDPAPDSDKPILLLSIRNLNYEGPSSSVENSDEGCFSACSMETTSTSADLWKSATAHVSGEAPDEAHLRGLQTHAINETQDKHLQPVDSDAGANPSIENEESEAAQHDSDRLLTAGRDETSEIPPTNTKQIENNPDQEAGPHDLQPADDSPPTPHRKIVDRSSSLLQRLLAPRKRQHPSNKGPSTARKPARKQMPKKGGAVKAIPSSTTLMMFVLTATFIINYLPHLVIITLRAMSDSFGQGLTGALLNVYNIGLRSYFMNCAANSLVYGFCSARFRQECRLLFSRK